MRPREGEAGGAVVKRGSRPRGRGVALFARLRKARLHMVRVSRALEVLQVAGDAGRARDVVVAVDVTLIALHCRVRAGQSKSGRAVIENSSCPGGCSVALFARLWKACLYVVRVCRALEILQVAGNTARVRDLEIIVGVALLTS